MSAILATFWEDLDFGNIDVEAAFKVLTILENVDGQDRYQGTSLIKKRGRTRNDEGWKHQWDQRGTRTDTC